MGAAFCALALGLSTSESAQGDLSADQIAERAVRTDSFNWEAARTRVRMVLIDADGSKKERSMEVLGRRKDGRYQSMVRFLGPADIAGTAFLMLESGKDESEQYIYLPGLKRTRRIVGREREGSFMGSDFTYADLQGIDNKKAKHVKLADENVGSEACYVVESTIDPSAKVAYGKIVTWVRKSDFIALRTRFHDKSGKLLKTLYSRKVKPVEGKPVVVEARMQNENKHVTELFVDSIEKQTDLADSTFTPSALEHL